MTLPRSVADVLSGHVTFELESIDRLYCNLYVPQLQRAEGIVGFFRGHLGRPIASTAVIAPMSRDFVTRLRGFADQRGIPRIDFAKGRRKDDVMHEHLARFRAAGRTEGVLFVGRAQEKNTVFRTEKRRAADGRAYPWIVRTTSVVNQFYVHCVDEDSGAFFLKFSYLLPLRRQAADLRASLGPGPGREGRDRVYRAGQRVRCLRRPGGGAGDLRRADRGHHRGAGPQVAGRLAESVLCGRPGRRVPLRHLGAAGRVLPHPGPGQAGQRADLFRPGHRRQPRHLAGPTRSA